MRLSHLMRSNIPYIIFIIGITVICAPSARAQSAGLSISPPTVEILLAPNKKIIQTFSITNRGENGQFIANFYHFEPKGKDGHVTISPSPISDTSLPVIISLSNHDLSLGEPFSLEAGKSRQLVVGIEGTSIENTVDAYFALVITPYLESNAPGQAMTVPGIASLIMTTLTGNGIFPLNIEIAGFDLPLIQDSMTPLPISAYVANKGPVMLRPEGKLEILSPRDKHNTEIALYPHLLLGNSSRKLYAQQGSLLCQNTQGKEPCDPVPLTWKPTLRNLGPYRFRLTLSTIGGTKMQEIEKTVWLVPIKAILVGIVTAIVCIVFIMRYRHKHIAGSLLDTPIQKN